MFSVRVLKNGLAEITQEFGGNHIGIDLVGNGYTLDDVVAHSSGVVTFTQTGRQNNQGSTGNESYGNFVIINHGNGYETLYAHLNNVYVNVGEEVEKGSLIGTMGNTGNSYGAHLHFEIIKDGIRINPFEYLDKDLFENIVNPTIRDENKNQLKINVVDLRIRKEPNIESNILGLTEYNGIYDYYETVENEGYTWYKIGDDNWIASTQDWITVYPKKEEVTIDDLIKEIEILQNQINILENENSELKENLKEFNPEESGLYYLELLNSQTLIYKKVTKQ